MRRHIVAIVAATAAAAGLAFPTTASAHQHLNVHLVTDQVGAPFNLALTQHGVLVADGAGYIGKVNNDGSITQIVSDVEGATGVAVTDHGKVLAYTSTTTDQTTFTNTASSVTIQRKDGSKVVADTLAWEGDHNRDSHVLYGIDHPTKCQQDALEPLGGANYMGGIDSHAYTLAAYKHGFALADAGGNDLLYIDKSGSIRKIAVLPRQPTRITADFASA